MHNSKKTVIDGGKSLFDACRSSDYMTVKGLLEEGADCCALNSDQKSPLNIAIEMKDRELIKLLVEYGALKANDQVCSPFLVHIPEMGDLELFHFVLKKGKGLVDVNDKDKDGRGAFHYAIYNGHEQMLQLIIASGFDLSSLFIKSAKRGDYYYVKSAIEYGMGLIDINAVDEMGNTALHYASLNSEERIVKFLVESGADKKKKNLKGYTAFTSTADEGIRKLLQ